MVVVVVVVVRITLAMVQVLGVARAVRRAEDRGMPSFIRVAVLRRQAEPVVA
jgi:hypothetical protein